jgi:hypothetical protein
MCIFNYFSIVFAMKKDLLIIMSSFSFFTQHLGKPHQLFYFLSLYECDDFNMRPGYYRADMTTKYR